MSKINDGGPAFPQNDLSGYGMGPVEIDGVYKMQGMSLRDWFAGQFLAGSATDNAALDVSVAADQFDIDAALSEHWANVARAAYIAADCMLAARSPARSA